MVSTHSRLKAAGRYGFAVRLCRNVSTHSRLKAAGAVAQQRLRLSAGFNTQPPEGGWPNHAGQTQDRRSPFQHTAA